MYKAPLVQGVSVYFIISIRVIYIIFTLSLVYSMTMFKGGQAREKNVCVCEGERESVCLCDEMHLKMRVGSRNNSP